MFIPLYVRPLAKFRGPPGIVAHGLRQGQVPDSRRATTRSVTISYTLLLMLF